MTLSCRSNFLVRLKINVTVFWAEYGHLRQGMPNVHFSFYPDTPQTACRTSVHTPQHNRRIFLEGKDFGEPTDKCNLSEILTTIHTL